MMSFRSKPVGWRNESYRHYLASKGIASRMPVETRVFRDVESVTEGEKARRAVELQKEVPGTGMTRGLFLRRFQDPAPTAEEAIRILERYEVDVPEEQKETLRVAEDLGGSDAVRRQLAPMLYQLREREISQEEPSYGYHIIRRLPLPKEKGKTLAGPGFFRRQQLLKELEGEE